MAAGTSSSCAAAARARALACLAWACAASSGGCAQPARSAHAVLVSQAGSTTLAVVDPDAGGVVDRIEVGELPHRLLATRDGSRVYAVLVGSQALAEIDTRTLEVRRYLRTAPVPSRREDGTPIEAHTRQNAFEHDSCFDCHRPGGAQPAIVGLRPVGIALSRDETRLYVCHIRGALLSVIDRESGALVRSRALQPDDTELEAADLARVGQSLVVSLREPQPSTAAGSVRFLDEATLQTQAQFETGTDPASLLALPDRDSVLLSNFDTNTVSELGLGRKPRTLTVTPGPLGSLQLPDGAHALTLDYYSNAASLLELDSGEVTPLSLRLGEQQFVNPTHAALSPDGELAYVVSSGTDGHLLTLDLGSRELQSATAIDGLSFDVVVIPH